MRSKDAEAKELPINKKKPEWKKFEVPDKKHYIAIVNQMDHDYVGCCPVCLHHDLVFLSNSGVWQASKDKTKPGLPYGHKEQVVRWCCTCCNNALQQATDRTLYQWFSKIVAAKNGPIMENVPTLTKADEQVCRTCFNRNSADDRIIVKDAQLKGYTVAPGPTAEAEQFVDMVRKQRFCSTTNVTYDFVSGPNCISVNRKVGYTGDRNKSIGKVKYLHSLNNIEPSCRALNLAQRDFSKDQIMEWVRHIQTTPSVYPHLQLLSQLLTCLYMTPRM